MVKDINIVNNNVTSFLPNSYYKSAYQYIELSNKLPFIYSSLITQDNTKKMTELLYYTNLKMIPPDINNLRILDINFDLRKCE